MLIGYIWVSKIDGSQVLDLQRDVLLESGIDPERIYEDLASGRIDTLNKKNIGFKVIAGAGAQIDTTTANGRLIFGIFPALAEFEAELIRERTKAGLAAARDRGRLGGRPRKMTLETLKMAMVATADPKTNASEVANRLGITTTTQYAYVNGDGSVKESGQRLLTAKSN